MNKQNLPTANEKLQQIREGRATLEEARHKTKAAKTAQDLLGMKLGEIRRIPWPSARYEVDKVETRDGVDTFAVYAQAYAGDDPKQNPPVYFIYGGKTSTGKYGVSNISPREYQGLSHSDPQNPSPYSDEFNDDLKSMFGVTVNTRAYKGSYSHVTIARFHELSPQAKSLIREPVNESLQEAVSPESLKAQAKALKVGGFFTFRKGTKEFKVSLLPWTRGKRVYHLKDMTDTQHSRFADNLRELVQDITHVLKWGALPNAGKARDW